MSRPIRLLSSTALALSLASHGIAVAQPQNDDPFEEEDAGHPEEDLADEWSTATSTAPPEDTRDAEPAPAEPAAAASAFAIAGFINTTYNYNLNRPASGTNGFYSYNAQHNSLLLNAAHLALTGKVGDAVAWTVELDFGADALVNTYAHLGGIDATGAPVYAPAFVDVQEAYGVYTHDKLGVKVGKFATYQGIEVIESPDNPTISRGYLYGLAESFYHTGAVVTYQATDKLDVAAGVIQGWDVLYDTNRGKMGVFKVGLEASDKLAVSLSGYLGPDLEGNDSDSRVSVDLTGVFKPSPKVELWFQGNFGNESADPGQSWFGVGLQPVFHLNDDLAVGARVEFFKDEGARTGGERQLINISAAPAYTIAKGFVVRVEARVDISNVEDFDDRGGGAKKSQIGVLADATMSF